MTDDPRAMASQYSIFYLRAARIIDEMRPQWSGDCGSNFILDSSLILILVPPVLPVFILVVGTSCAEEGFFH
eukprot:COSAG02_NODE_1014_length_15195_cov_11.098105_7_plen_72_part_00